jgi:hypothetical protein
MLLRDLTQQDTLLLRDLTQQDTMLLRDLTQQNNMLLRDLTQQDTMLLWDLTTEWQRLPSGVHSIMMEKFAQAGEGGGCTPTPVTLPSRTKLQCTVPPVERADTLTVHYLNISSLSLCTLWPGQSLNSPVQKRRCWARTHLNLPGLF